MSNKKAIDSEAIRIKVEQHKIANYKKTAAKAMKAATKAERLYKRLEILRKQAEEDGIDLDFEPELEDEVLEDETSVNALIEESLSDLKGSIGEMIEDEEAAYDGIEVYEDTEDVEEIEVADADDIEEVEDDTEDDDIDDDEELDEEYDENDVDEIGDEIYEEEVEEIEEVDETSAEEIIKEKLAVKPAKKPVKKSSGKSKKKKKKGKRKGKNSKFDITDIDFELIKEKATEILIMAKPSLKYMIFMAVSLIYWEVLMMLIMGGFKGAGLFFLFFIPAQALFFVSFMGIGNDLSTRITLPIVTAIPAIYYIVQLIYLKNFGSLFSISMAGMGGDALNDFGWAVADTIVASIFVIILILLPVIVAIVMAIKNILKFEPYKWYLHLGMLLVTIIVWFIGVLGIRCFGTARLSPYYLYTSTSVTTDTTARKLGVLTTAIVEGKSYYFGDAIPSNTDMFIEEIEDEAVVKNEEVIDENGFVHTPWMNEALDFNKLYEESTDTDIKSLAHFFANREASTTNEYTGMFEGYNLIYICAESFWEYGCNELVTPTLYKMAHNGIVLNNYYNSFFNTTTNGEFAFDTSLWPDVSRNSKNGTDVGSFAQSASKYMPQGLGDLFTAQGIPSYGFHNYYGRYYRRILSWPNLGYNCRFTGDRGMYFTYNWPASDLELMQQTVDDYINDDQFHAYYMTFSGHGPYTYRNSIHNQNIGTINSILGTDSMSDIARGYLAGELELDRAMEYLLKRLEEAGKLENTVIVLTGDHYPYYLDAENRTSLVGFEMDEAFDIYHSNCFIYNAGITEPIYVDDYCCNIDIAPTVLNLFNIPFDSRLMMGRDIFSPQAHKRATLYNMSFLTDMVRYNYETGEAIWSDLGNQMTQDEKTKYLDKHLNNIENEYTAACEVIEHNFYLELYKNAGLLTGTELEEELAREERVRADDANYNAEDEARQAAKEAEEAAAAAAAAAAEGGGNGLVDVNGDGVIDENDIVTLPDGTHKLPDGTIVNADGTIVEAGTALDHEHTGGNQGQVDGTQVDPATQALPPAQDATQVVPPADNTQVLPPAQDGTQVAPPAQEAVPVQ